MVPCIGRKLHLMVLMRPMGEVEAGYIHASLEQLLQHGHTAGLWAQGAYHLWANKSIEVQGEPAQLVISCFWAMIKPQRAADGCNSP